MGKPILLFDVDGTLTVPRKKVTQDMLDTVAAVRAKGITVGVVGGSDMVKQREQLGEDCTQLFDYNFAENGLMAFKAGEEFHRQSWIKFVGEEKQTKLVNYIFKLFSEVDCMKRGTFIEYRNGMLNVSPIGRACSQQERDAFEQFDKEKGIRKDCVAKLQAFDKAELGDCLQFSIGGQISFDVFPKGWDKTYCLQFVEKEFDEIHFFGDKTFEGGNDYEIFEDKRTIGHTVKTYEDTIAYLKENYLQ